MPTLRSFQAMHMCTSVDLYGFGAATTTKGRLGRPNPAPYHCEKINTQCNRLEEHDYSLPETYFALACVPDYNDMHVDNSHHNIFDEGRLLRQLQAEGLLRIFPR
jgi:hypothetical protein